MEKKILGRISVLKELKLMRSTWMWGKRVSGRYS